MVLTNHLEAARDANEEARKLIEERTAKLRPLEIETGLAWWKANISGKDEDFRAKEKAENRLNAALADPLAFRKLKQTKERGKLDDPVIARAIEVLYLAALEKQVDSFLLEKMVAKSNAVEKAFNAFRAVVDGKELTQNDIRKVLEESTDSAARRKAWEASKAVGPLLEKDLSELVKLRNEAARQLNFKNYHALQLYLNEQNGPDLIKIFDELDELTREPFRAAKAQIDAALARQSGVKPQELMPWHYHDLFFQETPKISSADLDAPFRKADLPKITREFYESIGLPVDDVLERSDLYERPGKSPHAFCTDIDREGDVRVLCNVVPDSYWMSTMLHEFGHAVYSSKNIPRSVPYVFRREAHILTTEGVAMMFERVTKRSAWLKTMGIEVSDPAAYDRAGLQDRRYQLLIFSRWCQVMLRFEKSMYENPDQDLGKLWWDLVERYQMLKRPAGRNAPDYAAKIHIVSAPVYYHNYMLGQLFASQVHQAIARDVMGGAKPDEVMYTGNKGVGKFMVERVFAPGRKLTWDELTRHATGESLSAKAFAADLGTAREATARAQPKR